eukprot:448916-Rhodomonas_salina.3
MQRQRRPGPRGPPAVSSSARGLCGVCVSVWCVWCVLPRSLLTLPASSPSVSAPSTPRFPATCPLPFSPRSGAPEGVSEREAEEREREKRRGGAAG